MVDNSLFHTALRVDYLTVQSDNATAERGILFNLANYTFTSIAQAEAAVIQECREHGETLQTLTIAYVTKVNNNPCNCGANGGSCNG